MTAAEVILRLNLRHAEALLRLRTRARRRRLRKLVKKARRDETPIVCIDAISVDSGPTADQIDNAMMARALELAEEAAERGEVPVGAVLYRGTTIIAEAA